MATPESERPFVRVSMRKSRSEWADPAPQKPRKKAASEKAAGKKNKKKS
jgi:hypothetical protein